MSSEPPLPLRKPPGYRDPGTPARKAVKLPPTFQKRKRRRSCCRILCCCVCISLFLLMTILAVAGFLLYLWYQPRLPEIQLKSIAFTKFNVTGTPPVLDAQSNIDVVIKNPNQKLGIVYGRTHIVLSAVDGDVNLGEQTVAGFNQDKNNVTRLRFATKVQREALDAKSAEELRKGFKDKKLVMNAEIRSGVGLRPMNPVQVNVLCVGITLNQLPPKCRLKLLNWFFIN